jgi:hypothetical protein
VHPGVERRDCYRRVQRRWGCDAQQVKLTMLNKLLPIRITMPVWNAVGIAKPLQRIGLHASQGHKINVGSIGVSGHVLLASPTETDYTGA